jgi:hypothetical protein
VPKVQIGVGVLALVVAALLATNVLPRRFERPYPGLWERHVLNGRSLWVSGVAGLGMALPSVDYLAVLAVILASGAAAVMQAGALLIFNLVAFALVEVPLVAYLLAPDRTRAVMTALNGWIRSRSRRAIAALLAGLGCALVVVGLAGL